MRNLIYDWRWSICAIPFAYIVSSVVEKYTDLSPIPHLCMCTTIMIGLFPIVEMLDNKFIKQKGDN